MQSDIELGLLILHFFVSKLLQVANLSKQLVNEILKFWFFVYLYVFDSPKLLSQPNGT